jgi:UDP-N-acetylmuramate dehydrogenase
MRTLDGEALLKRLPGVRGRLEANAPLAELTWFRAGGAGGSAVHPGGRGRSRGFPEGTPKDVPVYVIGVGSNLLVRDGGVPGVVIRLGAALPA